VWCMVWHGVVRDTVCLGLARECCRCVLCVGPRAHDLTVAQPVSDTHLDRPGVGPILPIEVLAQTWANIKLFVILFATFSQKYTYFTGALDRRSMRREAGSAKNRREGVAREQNYTCITILLLHAEAMALARDWRRVCLPDS
jgi:hypothetical protein